jgi:multidrug efflux pump subunit AcrA (membrane-fusion protein)
VLDPVTRTARVRCTVVNAGRRLRPEMAPELSIALPARRGLGVPRAAVLRLGEDLVVFVAAGATADGQRAFRPRKVVVGEAGPDGVVPVRDGLVEGEEVVTEGGIFLVGLL